MLLCICFVCEQNHPLGSDSSQADMSGLDKFTVPCLEVDQCALDASLVVFGHVLMHIRVVLPDVALSAAVRNCPEAKGRRIGVWTLELQGEKEAQQKRDKPFKRRKVQKGA